MATFAISDTSTNPAMIRLVWVRSVLEGRRKRKNKEEEQ